MDVTGISTTKDAPREPRVRLAYLDGLRGLAALYVTITHIFQFVYTGVPQTSLDALPSWFGPLSAVFKFGIYAVAIFIVLSGYCLMLPVARSEQRQLAGGVKEFALRRARRILPAYYAVLVVSIVLAVCIPDMKTPGGTLWDLSHPTEALSLGSLFTHALLIHNLTSVWCATLDPPLWSVGLEWQIYFVFALVLLPVWRKMGTRGSLPLAFALGLLPIAAGFGFAETWLIGLFGLGMAAAVVNFSPTSRLRSSRFFARFPWIPSAVCLAAITIIAKVVLDKRGGGNASLASQQNALLGTAVGLAAALLLVGYTHQLQSGKTPPLLSRLLEGKWAIGLGHFSYSLYLTHYPLLALVYMKLVLPLGLSPVINLLILLIGFLPGSLLFAWGWFRAFEKPFLRA